MNVHQFIQSHQKNWQDLDAFLKLASRVTLMRVPLEEFRTGSRLYRECLSDLGFARMRFSNHKVVKDLEELAGRAHSVIYQARRVKRGSSWRFWIETWPATVMECKGYILTATAIFWIASVLGFFLAARFPILEAFFISPPMRKAIEGGHLWTESITSAAPQVSQKIATNNISVSLLAWGLGVTFGIGTVWLLVFNGLMLGVIFAGCLRAGMFLKLGEFVVAHGSLELPAIWIAGGAGLMIGDAMLFPKRYSRSVELGLAGQKSVRLVIGVIPMLLIAGFVEAFISPSDLSPAYKVLLSLNLAGAYAGYVFSCARWAARPMGPRESSN